MAIFTGDLCEHLGETLDGNEEKRANGKAPREEDEVGGDDEERRRTTRSDRGWRGSDERERKRDEEN